jgi:hypothetical protein
LLMSTWPSLSVQDSEDPTKNKELELTSIARGGIVMSGQSWAVSDGSAVDRRPE